SSLPVQPAFVSYSIEWANFPDYAGNKSTPNLFSETLLNNIAAQQGVKPVIRVGGETQDYALLDGYLKTALNNSMSIPTSADGTLEYGGVFFESYATFTNTKYIHGFNLAKSNDGFRRNLEAGSILACNGLKNGRLLYWELGNEPDMYKKTQVATGPNQGHLRPTSYSENTYATEWSNITADLRSQIEITCPEMITDQAFQFTAPSFAGTSNGMDPWTAWTDLQKATPVAKQFSSHFYAATPDSPNLKSFLSNHTFTTTSLAPQIALARKAAASHTPFALTETNFLARQGQTNLSDTFAAALWTLDASLYAAANNISRVHTHMGTDFPASSWQPINTKVARVGARPAYYANVAAAAMVGKGNDTTVVHLATGNERLAAYAAYEAGLLKRVMLLNMAPHASSANTRTNATVFFAGPLQCQGPAALSRLQAKGSDALADVSWNGYAFDGGRYGGQARRVVDVPSNEQVRVGQFGSFGIDVPDSEAVLVSL
ncbi:hypothetical protein BT63DRAFT_349935, partial [Microthyrium microscopicum]